MKSGTQGEVPPPRESVATVHPDRIGSLEAALAHLERNYDLLNSVVVAQAKGLAKIQKRLESLEETWKAQEVEGFPPHNTKPPHHSL